MMFRKSDSGERAVLLLQKDIFDTLEMNMHDNENPRKKVVEVGQYRIDWPCD